MAGEPLKKISVLNDELDVKLFLSNCVLNKASFNMLIVGEA
jgi:hypothetical protein